MADVEITTNKARVREQFGASAAAYVASPGHAAGEDLAQLVAWAEGGPDRVALDVATGGGHTALALAAHYGRVVATDLTEPMLVAAESFIRAQGIANVAFRVADAEALPFADATFDAVSCRIAPHHFPEPARFVAEAARVLKPGGLFLLEDSVVPEDPALDAFINRVEALRDHTHARTLSATAWRDLLTASGLRIEAETLHRKPHPFDDWLARSRTSDADRATLTALFRDASPVARATLDITFDAADRVLSFTDDKLLLKARKE
jgi:SAM-dependent methyltransferase